MVKYNSSMACSQMVIARDSNELSEEEEVEEEAEEVVEEVGLGACVGD